MQMWCLFVHAGHWNSWRSVYVESMFIILIARLLLAYFQKSLKESSTLFIYI